MKGLCARGDRVGGGGRRGEWGESGGWGMGGGGPVSEFSSRELP